MLFSDGAWQQLADRKGKLCINLQEYPADNDFYTTEQNE